MLLPLVDKPAPPARPEVRCESIGYRPPPGRYPVWRRVCNQAPHPFGDVIREEQWWVRSLRASTDEFVSIGIPGVNAAVNVQRGIVALVVSYHRYSRVRVVIRGETPRGSAFEISRECPPFEAEPLIVVPSGATTSGSSPR